MVTISDWLELVDSSSLIFPGYTYNVSFLASILSILSYLDSYDIFYSYAHSLNILLVSSSIIAYIN